MMFIIEKPLDIQGKIFNALYKQRNVQTEVKLSVSSLALNEVSECTE